MIELKDDHLVFRFPEVHEDAVLKIGFQRTLRIPDDNREHNLPPDLETFSLEHVDDHADRLPADWERHGGVFLPMHQAEAMWIHFTGSYPMAVRVAAGKVNAVTGELWRDEMSRHPQDYLVVPDQLWLDGFCAETGLVRQFVAMPLEEGYTAEEQLTGEARHGGVQISVFPIKAPAYEAIKIPPNVLLYPAGPYVSTDYDMGLAPGGLMRQKVYEDRHGFDAWEKTVNSRCFVHILNSVQFLGVTGEEPPQKSPTAQEYTKAGLPWFDYYGGDLEALKGAKGLAGLDSVAVKRFKKGESAPPDNDPVKPAVVRETSSRQIREGDS